MDEDDGGDDDDDDGGDADQDDAEGEPSVIGQSAVVLGEPGGQSVPINRPSALCKTGPLALAATGLFCIFVSLITTGVATRFADDLKNDRRSNYLPLPIRASLNKKVAPIVFFPAKPGDGIGATFSAMGADFSLSLSLSLSPFFYANEPIDRSIDGDRHAASYLSGRAKCWSNDGSPSLAPAGDCDELKWRSSDRRELCVRTTGRWWRPPPAPSADWCSESSVANRSSRASGVGRRDLRGAPTDADDASVSMASSSQLSPAVEVGVVVVSQRWV